MNVWNSVSGSAPSWTLAPPVSWPVNSLHSWPSRVGSGMYFVFVQICTLLF